MCQIPNSMQHGLTRRGLLKAGLWSGLGLALYSGELERHWIETTRLEMPLPGLSPAFEGMRVVQVSDIHMDEYTEPFFLRHMVDTVNALKPEIVLLTGDFVSEWPGSRKFARGAAWQCAELLDGLACRSRYAIMGNHDVLVGKDAVMEAMFSPGVTVLDNDHVPIERDGARWWLAGVDDPLVGKPEPESAIPDSIRHQLGEPVVLMCHCPDYADALIHQPAGRAVHLMLSGHTHGGQVKLPFLTRLKLPILGQKYVEGHFTVGSMQLYVSRGIGTVGIPFRLACPPEITLMTLRRA